jgi:hypothetical protein
MNASGIGFFSRATMTSFGSSYTAFGSGKAERFLIGIFDGLPFG